MTGNRASGILLHPTSLPGRYGIGDLGKPAFEFIDFLHETGQKLWQVLPLHPTGYGNSPYQSFSVHAGNPLLINPDILYEKGLLSAADIGDIPAFSADSVDYNAVSKYKISIFKKSFHTFERDAGAEDIKSFESFCETKPWLDIYAMFMAIKEANYGAPWYEWEEGLKARHPDILAGWITQHQKEILYQKYTQFLFFEQWKSLKQYCNNRSIRIIGDVPIFVALDSAFAWAYPDLLYLDELYRPTVVAGVPPDYFSRTGQRWGNPLYRWDVMARQGYSWWIERFKATYDIIDIIRLDHFRGFEKSWQIPANCATAEEGMWIEGPGQDLFLTAEQTLGKLPIIAEDLGVITAEVEQLRDRMGYPGMRVLQFAFEDDYFKPYNYINNCVVYTGTHDNDTVVGWFNNYNNETATQSKNDWEKERHSVLVYTGTDGSAIHWDFIRMAMASVADWAVIPLQDVLGLGSEARMNHPGTNHGNWCWRYRPELITEQVKTTLREMTEIYGR